MLRKLVFVRALGPLTITILSIAISNIFKLWNPPSNISMVGYVPAVRPCAWQILQSSV
jgi:hypothetical protein